MPNRPNRIVAAVLPPVMLAVMLAGCASAGPPPPPPSRVPGGEAAREMLRRAEVRRTDLPSRGEPGVVAAADRAFARLAREEGQWSAFAATAAPGALLHGLAGPFEAAPWLADQRDPPASVDWSPTAVWTSCDGTTAVSFGRSREPDGVVGSYVTVWELQGDGEYRWVYDMGGPDNPQPPPPPPRATPDIDTIVVPAIEVIDGRVAECRQRGSGVATMPTPAAPNGQGGGGFSADGTLAWRWEHQPDNTRRLTVDYLREGRWERALDFVMPPEGARR